MRSDFDVARPPWASFPGRFSPAALILAAVSTTATGADPETDKSRYTLFNPVPRALMRPMETDRPDKTESPYTVDAGHFQVEMDLVAYAHDRESVSGGNVTTEAFAVAPMNWKAGLVNHVDLQVVVQTYNHVRVRDSASGATETRSGFGDVITRLKINMWGDDGGLSALAVMPYVTSPTSQDGLGADGIEGGVIIPFALELPGGWGLGMMTEADFGRAEDGDFATGFVNTITLGHALVGQLSGYVEFFSEVSTDPGADWVGTADFGLTFAATENLQLDAGINVGVTRSAPDLNPFLGLSCRF